MIPSNNQTNCPNSAYFSNHRAPTSAEQEAYQRCYYSPPSPSPNPNSNPNVQKLNQCHSHQQPKLSYDEFLLSLNPKNETGVLDFIQRNPCADGRGIVIAILDTGVDPGAAGLTQTTDGKIKVIERYDCTGAGDVDTCTIIKSTTDLTLLSGRNFKIPATWKNPSGEYNIGLKPVFHLYPEEVKDRITQERRDRSWTAIHHKEIAKAEKSLEDYNKKMSSSDNNSSAYSSNELSTDLHMTLQDKFMKTEITARVETLLQLNKSQYAEDHGPYLDCIVFKNACNNWQICLVPTDVQDLEQAILLHEYNVFHEYSPLSQTDRFNVSVNVWNDGNLLEIVGMSDDHGTHVASISAGYFPDSPMLNGVAPGAQIISLTIGDNRINGNETGTAYARAIARASDGTTRIHVINTSFGEAPTSVPAGKLAHLMRDVVDKRGVIWVSASGNDGPALSTCDSPAVLCDDCIIGVAAYVSPEMMVAHSQTREKGVGLTYTWCSRGPALDGAMGINVCAPGGAITSVPNYTLMSCAHLNGSSMATPHASGCIALLLSLALQRGVDWTPYSIKKSLEVTASSPGISEPFSQGFGLIQVPSAYRMVEYFSNTIDKYVRYKIKCSGGIPGIDMHGIYIRDPMLDASKEFNVHVTPVFYQSDTIDPSIKIMFKQHLSIIADAHWIETPSFFELHNDTHSFTVRINPANMDPGVYYTRINAVDSKIPEKGPVFSIDVTYVVPIPISYDPDDLKPRVNFGTTLYTQGQIRRYFIEVPSGATWGVLRLKTTSTHKSCVEGNSCRFVVQTVTLLPGQSYKGQEHWVKVQLQLNEEMKLTFAVTERKVLEIAVGHWWQEGGDTESINLSASVKFRGIKIQQSPELICSTHDAFCQVGVLNLISSEVITPSAKLTHQIQLLKPIEMTLTTMTGVREEIPSLEKFIYELQIMYTFTTETCTEIEIDCPILSSLLYESDYLSQLWMLFDNRKKHVTSGDFQPNRWSFDIPPGDYFLRLQVRHEDVNALYRFMLPLEAGNKSRSIDKCKLNTTRSYNCGGEILPLLSVLLRMSLDSPIHLYCSTTLYDAVEYNECNNDGGENDEHTNCPYSDDFPITLRKNGFMICYVTTAIDENKLKDFPSSSTTYLEGKFSISNHHAGKHYCKSKLKVYFPQNLSTNSKLTFGESSDDDDDDRGAVSKPLHINPVDLLIDIVKPEEHLKNINKTDLSIEYLMLNKYFALAVKILLHRRKTHGNSWNKTMDSKLRNCFTQLGWTHCIYFLDSNSIVQNPGQYRPF